MISEVTRAAFSDELKKIAALKTQLLGAVNAGWHGHNAQGVPVEGAGWMLGNKGWRAGLPLGGKSMVIASTALQLPHVFGREDPTGRGHGRLERLSGLAGNTVGGLASTGALMRSRLGAKHPIVAGILGGLGGGIIGERVATSPWALKRRMFNRYPRPIQPTTDEGWRNVAPGGLNTTPDATVGQAQAM